jgi:serine/threonine-protein kinase
VPTPSAPSVRPAARAVGAGGGEAAVARDPAAGAAAGREAAARPGPADSPADAAAARRTLDSISSALDPASADEATARAANRALRALLPRLGTADDSTWAHLRLVEASVIGGDAPGGCRALTAARRTARTAKQREAVQSYESTLGCGAR